MLIMSPERQMEHLQKVSRTFALTIPLLPPQLTDWVGNAYLLCRIADTIEDDAVMNNEDKARELEAFVSYLSAPLKIEEWANSIYEKLKDTAKPTEADLIAEIPQVLGRYYSYTPEVRKILRHGVVIMCKGMSQFDRWLHIDSLDEVDHYCYSVAGVVGEILAALFAEYSATIKPSLPQMMPLAVSFGEGLQLTNILKDVWDDSERGIRWLPLNPDWDEAQRAKFTREYAQTAYGHVMQGLDFISMIPRKEKGIRDFCLLANIMAAMTLNNIYINPSFTKATDIKISRKEVKKVFLLIKLFSSSNWWMKWYVKRCASSMKPLLRNAIDLRTKVSFWQWISLRLMTNLYFFRRI